MATVTGGNVIEDVSPLAGLTDLTRLLLPDNRVEDISPLAGLTGLQELNLDDNRVADIAALEDLTNLDALHLAYNEIADISPLANNAGLDDGDLVDVRSNPLTDESFETAVPALVARGFRVEVSARPRFELVHNDSAVVLRVTENTIIRSLLSRGERPDLSISFATRRVVAAPSSSLDVMASSINEFIMYRSR